MMHRLFILLFALTATSVIAATYKWVDKDGTIHYSDTPVEGAERVDLPEPMVFEAPDVPDRQLPPLEEEPPFEYSEFAFIAPKQDQVFWATGGKVGVMLSLEPALRKGDEIHLYLNGERVENFSGLGTTLTEMWRGAYTLRADIVGPDGKTVTTAGPVTFHVKQHSIANPP